MNNKLAIPQNADAEIALLNCIIVDSNLISDLEIKENYFYKPENRKIFSAIYRLNSEGKSIDLITIKEQLRITNSLNEAGGEVYLFSLPSTSFSPSHADSYLSLLADAHKLRNIIELGTLCFETGYNNAVKADVATERISSAFDKLLSDDDVARTYSLANLVSEEWDNLNERITHPEKIGIPTGFKSYDFFTGGFHDSEQLVIAARTGVGKCLGKGTKVLLFNGKLANVEDIKSGDQLMGPDSKPRNVLSTTTGKEMMYWVRQNKGIDYRVNESHILSLKRTCTEWSKKKGEILNISVKDILPRKKNIQHRYKGYKVSIKFPKKPVTLDPYFIGLWLGDGCSANPKIYNVDKEVIDYIYEYAKNLGQEVHVSDLNRSCQGYLITRGKRIKHDSRCIKIALRNLNLISNKHIPESYLLNTKSIRLQVLAGLMDSDGYLNQRKDSYEIVSKFENLARDIKFLCDSLGYRTSIRPKMAKSQSGTLSKVWRIIFSGNIDEVPVKIKRKKAKSWNSKVDWTVTGIKIEEDKIDDYYGFTLDGDGLFLLEDMTVTHNTSLVLKMMLNMAKNGVGSYIWEFEMSRSRILQRLVSIESGVSALKIKNGKLTQPEYDKVTGAMKAIENLPIYIEEDVTASLYEIMSRTRKMVNRHGIKSVIIDHIQLVPSALEEETAQLGFISREMKRLAMDTGITSVLISQLNRNLEYRTDKRPILPDLRQSGKLEEDADKVLFIYRDELYDKKESNEGLAELILAKHRDGPIGSFPVIWNGECVDFTDMPTV